MPTCISYDILSREAWHTVYRFFTCLRIITNTRGKEKLIYFPHFTEPHFMYPRLGLLSHNTLEIVSCLQTFLEKYVWNFRHGQYYIVNTRKHFNMYLLERSERFRLSKISGTRFKNILDRDLKAREMCRLIFTLTTTRTSYNFKVRRSV